MRLIKALVTVVAISAVVIVTEQMSRGQGGEGPGPGNSFGHLISNNSAPALPQRQKLDFGVGLDCVDVPGTLSTDCKLLPNGPDRAIQFNDNGTPGGIPGVTITEGPLSVRAGLGEECRIAGGNSGGYVGCQNDAPVLVVEMGINTEGDDPYLRADDATDLTVSNIGTGFTNIEDVRFMGDGSIRLPAVEASPNLSIQNEFATGSVKVEKLTIADDEGAGTGAKITTLSDTSMSGGLPTIAGVEGDIAIHPGTTDRTGLYQYQGATFGWRKMTYAPMAYAFITTSKVSASWATGTRTSSGLPSSGYFFNGSQPLLTWVDNSLDRAGSDAEGWRLKWSGPSRLFFITSTCNVHGTDAATTLRANFIQRNLSTAWGSDYKGLQQGTGVGSSNASHPTIQGYVMLNTDDYVEFRANIFRLAGGIVTVTMFCNVTMTEVTNFDVISSP